MCQEIGTKSMLHDLIAVCKPSLDGVVSLSSSSFRYKPRKSATLVVILQERKGGGAWPTDISDRNVHEDVARRGSANGSFPGRAEQRGFSRRAGGLRTLLAQPSDTRGAALPEKPCRQTVDDALHRRQPRELRPARRSPDGGAMGRSGRRRRSRRLPSQEGIRL